MDISSNGSTRRESTWRRGWSDTKAAVTSWWFLLVDAIVGLLAGLAAGVISGGLIGSWQGIVVGALAGIGAMLIPPLCVMGWNFYRAPIRQRNEAWAREEQREHLRPVIGTQLEARVIRIESGLWMYSPETGFYGEPSELHKHHLLEVTNQSGVTITDYYAKFLDFRDSRNRTIDDLMGYELYWYKAGPDLPEKTMVIPSKTSRHLHIFTTTGMGNELGISQVVNEKYYLWDKRLDSIPSGEYYTAILEIGSLSEKVSVPPVDVELKIAYYGHHSLEVKIRAEPHIEIGPPEPDRTGL